MFNAEQIRTVVNFLRDSAKIVFGSFVVGAFLSFPEKPVSWTMFSIGAILTVFLLLTAVGGAKYIKEKS